jgi:hypothetical protein
MPGVVHRFAVARVPHETRETAMHRNRFRPERADVSPELLALVRVSRIADVQGMHAWLVDGVRIRNELDIDFIGGGNPARYAYIPLGEIWIDQCTAPADRGAYLVHEVVECLAMQAGTEYEVAHARANRIEAEHRRMHPQG